MRGSAAFRSAVAPGGVLAGPWVKNALWRRARAVPSLDLRFAENKSLVDATTGQNLVTFTRSSRGTYVDSQGVIRTATTNLLLRSEEFGDAVWLKIAVSVNADVEVAPNGTLTADKLVEDTATSVHQLAVNLSFNYVSGTTYTLSCYIKAAGRSRFQLAWRSDWFPPDSGAAADLLAGTISPGANATGTITAVGNGWYRISVTSTADATGSSPSDLFLSLVNNAGSSNYTGDGTSGVFIWGAQLEQSSTVGEYIPTTSTINSAPRFDHNPTTGESLGLLVEEQRTNLLLQSEDFSTTWLAISTTITSNSDTAPNGALTADKLTWGAQQTAETYQTITLTAATWTFSIWAKTASGTKRFRLKYYNGTSDLFSAERTATTQWQRFSYTFTGVAAFGNVSVRNSSPAEAGDLIVWGAQLEAGAFPTSYIPTTTAAVTRSADVASITGTAFSSWYRQDEGTLFAQFNSATWNADTNFPKTFVIGTDDNNGFWIGGTTEDNQYRYRVRNGGANQFGAANITRTPTLNNKTAMAIKAADFAVAADGGNLATGSSGTVPTVNQMIIGSDITSANWANQPIRRLVYWGQRLPNSVLQAITQ